VQHVERAADDVRRAHRELALEPLEQADRGRVRVAHEEIAIAHERRVGRRVREALERLGAGARHREDRRELHDLLRAPALVEDRVVGALHPELAARLGDALELAAPEAAGGEIAPEGPVFRAVARQGIDEERVVLPTHLLERVAERAEEIVVRVQDRAVRGELDERLRAVDGGELGAQLGQLGERLARGGAGPRLLAFGLGGSGHGGSYRCRSGQAEGARPI
jgi:hypothetical protein